MRAAISTLLLLSVFLFSCHTTPKSSNSKAVSSSKQAEPESKPVDDFTIVNATYEKWVAGIQSGGSGTEYRFKLVVNTDKSLAFDSLWVNQRALKVFVAKEGTPISDKPVEFGKGDTITVGASDTRKPDTKVKNTNPPIAYSGAALLGYALDSKQSFFNIATMTEKKGPKRP